MKTQQALGYQESSRSTPKFAPCFFFRIYILKATYKLQSRIAPWQQPKVQNADSTRRNVNQGSTRLFRRSQQWWKRETGIRNDQRRKKQGGRGAGCGNGMRKCDVGTEAGNRYATKQRRFHKRCPRAIGENSIYGGNVANSRSVLWAPVRSTRTPFQISGRANNFDP